MLEHISLHQIPHFSIQILYGRNKNTVFFYIYLYTWIQKWSSFLNYESFPWFTKYIYKTQINIRIEIMNTLINYQHQIIQFFFISEQMFCLCYVYGGRSPFDGRILKPLTKTRFFRSTKPYIFMFLAKSMARWRC